MPAPRTHVPARPRAARLDELSDLLDYLADWHGHAGNREREHALDARLSAVLDDRLATCERARAGARLVRLRTLEGRLMGARAGALAEHDREWYEACDARLARVRAAAAACAHARA
jgi:hypothetical protein